MATRIQDIERDLPVLNKQLQELSHLRKRLSRAVSTLSKHEKTLSGIEKTREATGVNNIVFTWAGGTTTISWAAGSVQDREDHYLPIPAGSRVLAASTNYWAAWNPIHQVMAFATNLSTLNNNPNNFVLCRFKTGTGGQSGEAGGGGSAAGANGGWDPNRQAYIYF